MKHSGGLAGSRRRVWQGPGGLERHFLVALLTLPKLVFFRDAAGKRAPNSSPKASSTA